MQVEYCDFPDELLYDLEENVWVRTEDGKRLTLGITSVHAAMAGKLIKISFRPKATVLLRGKSVATIESSRYFGAVRTPVPGTLIETNEKLLTEPKLANDSPYEDGWFVRIESASLSYELKLLSDVKISQERLRSRIHELRVRCFKAFPDHEMFEIGVECAAVLIRLDELIERAALRDVIHVVSDDPTADIEMVRWSDQTGQEVLESRKEGNLMHFIVRKVK